MKIVKQMLKILGYILGGVICSALIVGAATLIVLTIYVTLGWLMSFESISLIIEWIMYIIVGAAIFIMGLGIFSGIVEWIKNKRNK